MYGVGELFDVKSVDGICLSHFSFLQALVEEKCPVAMLIMAEFYAKGKNVPQDQDKALHYYLQVAEARDAWMISRIIAEFFHRMTPPDYNKAYDFYLKAASQGDFDSFYELAVIIEDDTNPIRIDRGKAVTYLQIAANHGHRGAAYVLANRVSIFHW